MINIGQFQLDYIKSKILAQTGMESQPGVRRSDLKTKPSPFFKEFKMLFTLYTLYMPFVQPTQARQCLYHIQYYRISVYKTLIYKPNN